VRIIDDQLTEKINRRGIELISYLIDRRGGSHFDRLIEDLEVSTGNEINGRCASAFGGDVKDSYL